MPPVTDSDTPVVEAVRSGNVRSFSLLVDRHRDRAMTLAVRLVGDRLEAEEVVQDAFLRAFRALDGFRGDSRFSTWFYRILYNACMTRLRVSPRPPMEELPADGDRLPGLSDEPGLDERLETEEMRDILLEEMGRLPAAYSTALTLLYVQELRYEEIADVLRIPLGTVKTNIFRGRDLLRRRVLERITEEAVSR
ncbi:MAG TPA: sigma-70 family RNA polymerase sigma factor [Bacteroidota bacterium]|nr:sigma-70 family RNA polymerase sigma factor [Bacteroidota bacterium]